MRGLLLATLVLTFAPACRSIVFDSPPQTVRPPTPSEIRAAALLPSTVRFTLRTTVEVPGIGLASASTTTGEADLAKQVAAGRVVFDPEANVYDVSGHEVVRTGTHAYLRTIAGWVSCPLPPRETERGPGLSPMLPLDLLTTATRNWRAVGEEEIDGLDGLVVRHLRGEGDRLTLDVWIDGNQRPVRIDAVLRGPASTTTMRLDLRNYGSLVSVDVPENVREYPTVDAAFDAVGLR